MADTKTFYDLCERLSEEMKEIVRELTKKDKMTAGDLETIDKLSHAMKSIKTIIAMDEAYDDDYSGNHGGSYGRYYYDNDGMNGGMSNARGRTGNVKRDSMGRYARDNYSRRYARDGEKEHMISELREMMNESPDSRVRDMFQRFISEMENG